MPYAAVTYQKSDRLYTFYTSNPDINTQEKVLVRDGKGYSLCTFIKYVKKPEFQCNLILMSEHEMEDLAMEIAEEKMEEEFPIEDVQEKEE